MQVKNKKKNIFKVCEKNKLEREFILYVKTDFEKEKVKQMVGELVESEHFHPYYPSLTSLNPFSSYVNHILPFLATRGELKKKNSTTEIKEIDEEFLNENLEIVTLADGYQAIVCKICEKECSPYHNGSPDECDNLSIKDIMDLAWEKHKKKESHKIKEFGLVAVPEYYADILDRLNIHFEEGNGEIKSYDRKTKYGDFVGKILTEKWVGNILNSKAKRIREYEKRRLLEVVSKSEKLKETGLEEKDMWSILRGISSC